MHEPVHWFVDIQLFMICKIDKFCARGCYSIILFIILLFTLFRILRFSSLFIYFSHFSLHWNCHTYFMELISSMPAIQYSFLIVIFSWLFSSSLLQWWWWLVSVKHTISLQSNHASSFYISIHLNWAAVSKKYRIIMTND